MNVEAIRAGLPATTATTFLNTGTFGPLPACATRAMLDVLEEQGRDGRNGTRGIELWLDSQERAREALAAAVGAPSQAIAVMHATTDGVNTVLSGLPLTAGDEVVTTSAEHPGLTEPLALAVARHGIRVITCEAGRGVEERVIAAIGARTRLVAISHVLWNTGQVLDLAPIVAAVEAADARLLIDGAQAAGAIPLDVTALRADYYAFPGQKWLCGPDGTGGLYVRPDRIEDLLPPWGSHFTSDHSEGADRFWPGARRFDVGTVTIAALVGLAEAVHFRLEHGIEAGARYSAELANVLRRRLAAVDGVVVHEPAGAPSPFVVWQRPGHDAKECAAALEDAGVFVRYLPGPKGFLRASVGPWTNEADLGRLATALGRSQGQAVGATCG